MTTVVKFEQATARYEIEECYITYSNEDMSGDYVPLAEYEALEAHLDELGSISYALLEENARLRALLRRVVEIGPLLSEIFTVYEFEDWPKLEQLLADCREAE